MTTLLTKDPDMQLFIDDVRMPENHDVPQDLGDNMAWTIVRNAKEAKVLIDAFKPQIIAFDHDLGFGCTGYDVALWLICQDQEFPDAGYITQNFKYTCHSANPVGKKNILESLDEYMAYKFP